MKKAQSTLNINKLFKAYDTEEEDNLFDSSSASYKRKNIIPLKYIFNPGVKSATLIYYGCIVQENSQTFLQSVENLEARINDVKKLAIEFRNFENMDSQGLDVVGSIIRHIQNKNIDFMLSPEGSGILQYLIENEIIHPIKCAKNLSTALRQLSFTKTKFNS